MSDSTNTIETFANQEYKWGFVTDIEADAIPRGLNEDVIRLISAKKEEPDGCWNGGSRPTATGSP